MRVLRGKNKYQSIVPVWLILLVLIITLLTACSGEGGRETDHQGEAGAQEGGGSQGGSDRDSRLKVAAAIVPEATFVKEVGRELVEVLTMIPPGCSPANYAPSPGALTGLEEAVIYFSIGVPADLTAILPRLKAVNPRIRIVKLHEGVARVYPEREFSPGKRDPHIWLSPRRVRVMVELIARELAAVDPANREYYQENAREYQTRLEELDREIRDRLGSLEKRVFIIYHPSFGYFADDYELDMIAVEREGKEATTRHLQEVIDRARKEGVKTVFYQAEIDSRQSRAIADELKGEALQLAPLAADYIDNLRRTVGLISSSGRGE